MVAISTTTNTIINTIDIIEFTIIDIMVVINSIVTVINFINNNNIELNEETDYKKVFNMFNQNAEFILSVYVPNKREIVNYIMEQYTNIIDEIIC